MRKVIVLYYFFPLTQFLALNSHPKTSLPLTDFCQKYELEDQNIKQFKTRIINQIIKQIKKPSQSPHLQKYPDK